MPYHHHELRISGLKANEKYVIAVAAYTADGKLIGDSVGDSTKPILANHPLPVLTTWAFLSQVCKFCKYVIAVAAYTADGKLIGDSVGDSTKPILVNHPLPVLTTWAFLSQVC